MRGESGGEGRGHELGSQAKRGELKQREEVRTGGRGERKPAGPATIGRTKKRFRFAGPAAPPLSPVDRFSASQTPLHASSSWETGRPFRAGPAFLGSRQKAISELHRKTCYSASGAGSGLPGPILGRGERGQKGGCQSPGALRERGPLSTSPAFEVPGMEVLN